MAILMRSRGLSLARVAAILNAEGETLRGGRFHVTTLARAPGSSRRQGGRVTGTNDRKIALRLPVDTYDRAERVKAAMHRETLGVSVSTSEVLRLALLHGLKVLERRLRR